MIYHIQQKEDLDQKLKDAGEKLVVIDFFATWCGPCKFICPKLEELAGQHADNAVVLKVDVDECEDIAQEYNITSMPTFIFIKNNKIIDTFVGGNAEKLTKTMEKWINEQDETVQKIISETTNAINAATSEQAVEKM